MSSNQKMALSAILMLMCITFMLIGRGCAQADGLEYTVYTCIVGSEDCPEWDSNPTEPV